MDETMFGGRRPGKRGWRASGKNIVFDIYQRNGKVWTFPISSRARETMMPFITKYTKTGSLYYTDDWFVYTFLPIRGNQMVVLNVSIIFNTTSLIKKASFIFSALLVFDFMVSATLLTAYFGGISIYKWIWSRSIPISRYSHSGYYFLISRSFILRYPLTPFRSIFLRNRVIQTI